MLHLRIWEKLESKKLSCRKIAGLSINSRIGEVSNAFFVLSVYTYSSIIRAEADF